VGDDLAVARVEDVAPALGRPLRVQSAAQPAALAIAEHPVRMFGGDAALARGSKGCGPDARTEARVSDRLGQGGKAARELLVGLEPVAECSLVAVVKLHQVDRELAALTRLDELVEVAPQVFLADCMKELVPAAPAREEGRRATRTRLVAPELREVLEQSARVLAHRHTYGVQPPNLAGRQGHLEPQLDVDPHRDLARILRLAQHVHEAEALAALEHAHHAGRAPGVASQRRDRVGLVPASATRTALAQAVVHTAQPCAGRKFGRALGVEGARLGERPRLPAVLQETQRSMAVTAPAQMEHEALDLHGLGADVAKSRPQRAGARVVAALDLDLEPSERAAAGRQLARERDGPARLRALTRAGDVDAEAEGLDPGGTTFGTGAGEHAYHHPRLTQ